MKAFMDWISNNKGVFTGMVIGLVIAILIMTVGFGYMLLIAVCVGAGAFLGARPDVRAAIGAFFKHMFTPKNPD